MFTIETIKCPKCKTALPEKMQAENLEILKASYDDLPLTMKCFRCKYLITAKPDTEVTYEFVE